MQACAGCGATVDPGAPCPVCGQAAATGSVDTDDTGAICQAEKLEEALAEDPTVAGAWADAMGIALARIGATIDELTPVVLGGDTLVTNSAYRGGEAVRFPAILQAGTPVFVDRHGAPRVQCLCGNLLGAAPVEPAEEVTLAGPRWEDFDERRVTGIDSADRPVTELETIDVDSNEPATIPVGSTPPTPDTVPTPAPTTASTTTSTPTTTPTTTPPPPTTAVAAVAAEWPSFTGQALGPLRLDMSVEEARATGWLGASLETCSAILGGGPQAGNELFELDGPAAPPGLSGSLETVDDRVSEIHVTYGATMSGGVRIPQGWDRDGVDEDLRAGEYAIFYEDVFDFEDLARVTSPSGGAYEIYFGPDPVVGIPFVGVCD